MKTIDIVVYGPLGSGRSAICQFLKEKFVGIDMQVSIVDPENRHEIRDRPTQDKVMLGLPDIVKCKIHLIPEAMIKTLSHTINTTRL